MRKLVVGAVCGAMLTGATAVYAGDEIRAALFPAKYEVNGTAVERDGAYETLNYNGRAYVPIRFVAEQLDTVVAYEEESQTIKLDTGFGLASMNSSVKAGYIEVEKDDVGGGSVMTGRLYAGEAYWNELESSKVMLQPGSPITIKAYIAFYDDDNRVMDKVPISVSTTAEGDRILEFKGQSEAELTGYAFAGLESVIPEPIHVFLPPNTNVSDPSGLIEMEQTAIRIRDDVSQIRLRAIIRKDGHYRFAAELKYYDATGELLGNAWLESETTGLAEDSPGVLLPYHYYETATRADLSNAATYTVTLHELEPATEVTED